MNINETSFDFEPGPDFAERFRAERRPACQLYLISPPAFDLATHSEALRAALGAGSVAAYQLRMKGVADADVLAAAAVLQPICAAAEVAFIVNDRADLAAACGADGVHLGQGDGSVADARALLGREAQIGVTCHASRDLAFEAGEAGADYVAFGAFYPTTTKPSEHRPEPAILSWWTTISQLPCVAIGGITPANAAPLVAAGADFLAVSAGVWNGDPAANVRAFAAVMAG
ncbi:thiamine phosphate synthase [Sandaracinobacteroides saxicola]|uniref:Thiamine-phosphate synthase n=1 Tax=Sandaracinobacteroides saxicola TaxID=2759707 RepID=A0A7G5IK80_9SPHN|nr:thiamine phosphate synthase [Sandaracinobacteroides saxicola]QMW23772.1 thiamine phosphate synthase [Sandaracinobacteroides saxicola]